MKRCPFCAEVMHDLAIVCPHCGRDYPKPGEMPGMEERLSQLPSTRGSRIYATLLIGIILLIAAAAGWVYFYYLPAIGANTQESTPIPADLNINQETALNELVNSMGTLQVREQQQMLAADLQATLDAFQTQAAVANVTATADMAVARSHQVRLCKEGFGKEWDYTSNETISDQLKLFAENLGGEVKENTHILPWNVPYLAIHQLTNKYVFWFIVYFEQESTGFANSIYWIEMNCFLDIN